MSPCTCAAPQPLTRSDACVPVPHTELTVPPPPAGCGAQTKQQLVKAATAGAKLDDDYDDDYDDEDEAPPTNAAVPAAAPQPTAAAPAQPSAPSPPAGESLTFLKPPLHFMEAC
jgi:hypothetical protein